MWSGWRHRKDRKQRSIKGQSNRATVSPYTSLTTVKLSLIFSHPPSFPPIRHSLSHPSFSPSSFSLSYILPPPSPLLLFPSLFLPFSSPRGDTVHPRCVPDAFYQSRMSCRPWLSKRDVRGVSDEGKCCPVFSIFHLLILRSFEEKKK